MKKKIVFIYNNPLDGSYGGSQRTKETCKTLNELFDVIEYYIYKPKNKLLTFIRNAFLYSGNWGFLDYRRLKKATDNFKNIEKIFLDVSIHGRIIKKIKKVNPLIEIITNFHNFEQKYFRDQVRVKGFLYYPVYFSARYNEIKSIKCSEKKIFITREDYIMSGEPSNSLIIPITLTDKLDKSKTFLSIKTNYLLFVGAATFANIEAVNYLVNNIAKSINEKIIIVGKGMQQHFSSEDNIEVFDFVEDLSELYYNASAVLAPLFHGAGMKVKIAEALMYGKIVIGNDFSFLGYEENNDVLIRCSTSEEYVNFINKLNLKTKYYESARKLYEEYYDSKLNINYYQPIL